MSEYSKSALNNLYTEIADVQDALAKAATNSEGASNSAHYIFADRCIDSDLQTHIQAMLLALGPLPARLSRAVKSVFIELFQNICRYGYAEQTSDAPFGHISIYRQDRPSCAENPDTDISR